MIIKRKPYELGYIDKDETTLYEWANIRRNTTGLPFDIWVDEIGKNRNTKHNELRIKVTANNVQLDVIVHNHGEIEYANNPADIRKFGHKKELEDFILKVSPALKAHWNQDIDSSELGYIIRQVYKNKKDLSQVLSDIGNEIINEGD